MNDLGDVWRQCSLSLHTKFRLYSACVMTILLQDSETWTLNKRMWANVQAFHMQRQHRILSIKWNNFIPNVTVAATSGLDSIINTVCARRLGLFGHVIRFSHDVPVFNILSIGCGSGDWYPPDPSWRHSSGRRRTAWLDHISSHTGMSLIDIFSLAQDCSQWMAAATAAKASCTRLTGTNLLKIFRFVSRLSYPD